MRTAVLSTAALALALGASPFASAENINDDGLAIQVTKHVSKPVAISDSGNDNGNFRNNDLRLSFTNTFNQSTVVAATKLNGAVSGNSIFGIGNSGGPAGNGGAGGYGGDGGYANVKAKGGKGYAGSGGDGLTVLGRGGKGGDGGDATGGEATASQATGGAGGHGGAGGASHGGSAGVFNASNTLSGMSGVAGITTAIQNSGMASLQQVGITTMATVSVR